MLVSGLFIYPVKSCGGVAVTAQPVVERGFLHDRRFMIVDRAGVFVSQRVAPQLAMVKVELDESELMLSAPGATTVTLDAEPSRGRELSVQVWGDTVTARRDDRGSRWFSEYLEDDVSLVYMPDSARRPVNPQRARAGDIVSFADAYPFLLISEPSLADLNSRLSEPVSMARFRPNIVITGCAPYAEDELTTLRVGGLGFRGVKRCDRCSVTTVDPATGERGKEPLRTLAKYRAMDGKVWFGMNVIHDSSGVLRLGDLVTAD